MSKHWAGLGSITEDRGIGDEGTNNIWVNVGGWASVLDVTLTVGVGSAGWDTEGGSSVGNTI